MGLHTRRVVRHSKRLTNLLLTSFLFTVALLFESPKLGYAQPASQGTIPVPSVVGRHIDQARTILERSRFPVGKILKEPTDGVPVDTVTRQDPPAGTQVRVGTAVNLWIAAAPPQPPPAPSVVGRPAVAPRQPPPVPSVVGRHIDQARTILERSRFPVGEILRESTDRVPVDTVTGQDPPAGTQVRLGTAVNLWIAAALPRLAMPSVEGLHIDEARSRLGEFRLEVGEILRESTDRVPVDTVTGQDPPAGTQVSVDTHVNLWVAVPTGITFRITWRPNPQTTAIIVVTLLIAGATAMQWRRKNPSRARTMPNPKVVSRSDLGNQEVQSDTELVNKPILRVRSRSEAGILMVEEHKTIIAEVRRSHG